jgi:hypothetical protein
MRKDEFSALEPLDQAWAPGMHRPAPCPAQPGQPGCLIEKGNQQCSAGPIVAESESWKPDTSTYYSPDGNANPIPHHEVPLPSISAVGIISAPTQDSTCGPSTRVPSFRAPAASERDGAVTAKGNGVRGERAWWPHVRGGKLGIACVRVRLCQGRAGPPCRLLGRVTGTSRGTAGWLANGDTVRSVARLAFVGWTRSAVDLLLHCARSIFFLDMFLFGWAWVGKLDE